jgi:hypothetical protein
MCTWPRWNRRQARILLNLQIAGPIDNRSNLSGDIRKRLGQCLMTAIAPHGEVIVNPERDTWNGGRAVQIGEPCGKQAHVVGRRACAFDERLERGARHLFHQQQAQVAEITVWLRNAHAGGSL